MASQSTIDAAVRIGAPVGSGRRMKSSLGAAAQTVAQTLRWLVLAISRDDSRLSARFYVRPLKDVNQTLASDASTFFGRHAGRRNYPTLVLYCIPESGRDYPACANMRREPARLVCQAASRLDQAPT